MDGIGVVEVFGVQLRSPRVGEVLRKGLVTEPVREVFRPRLGDLEVPELVMHRTKAVVTGSTPAADQRNCAPGELDVVECAQRLRAAYVTSLGVLTPP
jgi:hypothetical protein